MLIQEYLSKDFPAFELNSSVEEALLYAEEFGFTHIFVKNKGLFLGGICKEFLEENLGKSLEALEKHLEKFAIMEDNTILDSVKLFYTFNANIIPVINNKEKYLGYISYDDVFGDLSKYPLFSERGAILTVETKIKTYSMTEIAKIIEGNNAKFYGSFISFINDEIIQITMKISNENLSSINETFERYGYHIVRKFYKDEKEDLIKDRYQYLQKYIEF